MNPQTQHTICVLDDGETWSGEGFTIEVTNAEYQRICDGEKPHEVVQLPGFPPPDQDDLCDVEAESRDINRQERGGV